MSTYIQGLGLSLPGLPVTNSMLSQKFGINSDWVSLYLKNNSRYFATDLNSGEEMMSLKDISYSAAIAAINNAKIKIEQIDFIIMATATPDKLMPATVNEIAFDLGLLGIPTFQLQSGCSGAIQAIYLAHELLSQEKYKYGLIIGADTCNKFIDPIKNYNETKPSEIINYALFGDGAGALVLSSERNNNVLEVESVNYKILNKKYDSGQIVNWSGIKENSKEMLMEDYKSIENNVPNITKEELLYILENTKKNIDQIDWFLFPQLSGKMTDKIIADINVDYEKTINCVKETGNNGNALLIFQLSGLIGKIKPNESAIAITVESSRWLSGSMFIKCKEDN